ncbi:hypothetical protein RB597_002930 [Gaeumannomyces tritici]
MADVRSLLRQQRARRIDHPHAAYSDAGRLLCLVCHQPVKPESWDAHVGTSTHRHRAAAKEFEPPAEPAQGPKRKNDEPEDKDAKRRTAAVMPPNTPRRAPHTPPLRQSGTPGLGVELQIPSRPATPNAREGLGLRISPVERTTDKAPTAGFTADKVDEDEWAAFEAEVVNAPAPVIVAAPMTAEQVAEQVAAEQVAAGTKRRTAADLQMEDEREEATRALETEFEEMEELEARVRRLKERREALRVRTVVKVDKTSPKEASDDEDESEDDWDAFRFR